MNANKVNQKSFFKIMILIFGLVCFFNVLTSAEKPPLPSEFKVFKIAVIGSSISDDGNGNKKIKHHKTENGLNLNKFTVDKLCSCGVGNKLSEYDVASVDNNLKNEEIELYKNYPERLPKDTILVKSNGEWVALSFYYISNCAEAEKIIPECQYAICPFNADSDEIKGNIDDCELKKRLTVLRDFIKQYNKTCDIRFLYYIDNIKQADNIGSYRMTISEFSRDLYNDDPKLLLQQEVQSHSLSKENGQCYRECFNSILVSSGRKVEEFEQLPNKKVLKINYLEVLEKITFADELKKSILNSLDTAYGDFICKCTTEEKANVNENSCYRETYNWITCLLINMSGDQLEEFYNNLCNVTVTREIDNGGVLFKILLNTKNKKERSRFSRFWNDPSFENEKRLFKECGKEKYKEMINISNTFKKIFSNKLVCQSICDSLKKIMLESIDVKNKCQICLSISTIEKDLDKSVFRVERTDKDDINENVIKKFMIVLASYYNDLYKIINNKIKGGAR